MGKVYAVGVGPGSPEYITERAKRVIAESDIVIGYRHSLDTVRDLLKGKDVRQVTLKSQEQTYNEVAAILRQGNRICSVTFTGDPSFSESEIIDRLAQIFGEIEIVPGISSVQVAASRSGLALDKSTLITFHVTGSIEGEKAMLLDALRNGRDVILLPRPWDFMPLQVAMFLKESRVSLDNFMVEIYEFLTLSDERVTRCSLADESKLARDFSDLSVMVIRGKTA